MKSMNDPNVPVIQPWKRVPFHPFYGGSWLLAADLDGDGEVELVTARNVDANDVHHTCTASAYKLDGSMLWTWGGPGAGRGELGGDVACQVHDWDGDGCPEVIVVEARELVVLDGGTGEERQRLSLPNPWAGLSDCLVFCDLRGTGRPGDVLVKSRYTQIYAYDRDWNMLWSADHPAGHRTAHQPFVLDIDHDGRDEVMVGYALLNGDGSERWRIRGDEDILKDGHLDCCRLLRDADDPEAQRLVFTYCNSFYLGCMNGKGRVLWAHRGEHYESVDVGRVFPDTPGNQLVVDIDKAPWGASPLLVFDEEGSLLSRFETNNSRHHDLISWREGDAEDILMSADPTVRTGCGEAVVRLAMDPVDRPRAATACDLTGDGRKDVLMSTWYGTAAYLYRNPGDASPEANVPLGTGLNFTLY